MNLLNVLNEIEKIDPDVYHRLDGRRGVVRNLAGMGSKLALAAVPLALGSMFSKAYGQSSKGTILNTLNFALTLEYLEAEFYRLGLAAMNLIPNMQARNAIQTIYDHEADHVTF